MRIKRVLSTSVVLAAALSPASPAASATDSYVALGDSFTAGPLIPDQSGSPAGCLRSDHNYPALVAKDLKPARFTDVSCSGAQTRHLGARQRTPLGVNPPQFDALTPTTTLVTLGIGGNDVGFGEIAVACGLASFADPKGAPCKAKYGKSLVARTHETAPKVAAALEAIHAKSPHARVLVVGYLKLLPDGAGCWPHVPIAEGDVPYLDGAQADLNDMLKGQARTHGARFVDAYAGGNGHDMCAAAAQRWVEGVFPTAPAAPIHPNATGMRTVANRVKAAIPPGLPLS